MKKRDLRIRLGLALETLEYVREALDMMPEIDFEAREIGRVDPSRAGAHAAGLIWKRVNQTLHAFGRTARTRA